jgi:murein DD-endopeptidase MepM/ murein hydrolase activator NlpD
MSFFPQGARAECGRARLLTFALVTGLLVLIVTTQLPATSARGAIADTWSWPVAPPWVIERSYVAPPTAYGVGHRGIDLAAALETPVLAPAPGVVLFAGTVVDRGVISIDHGNGVTSSFEPVIAKVITGQRVGRGERIGLVSGLHSAPVGLCACLHMGTRINGEYISPLAFLSTIERAVLLPWRD